MERREELLSGVCSFPQQMYSILPNLDKEITERFWNALWYSFLQESNISMIYWLEEYEDKKSFNQLIMHLHKAGWIDISCLHNYATISMKEEKLHKWIGKQEIERIRFIHKMDKYMMEYTKPTKFTLVKLGNKIVETGIIRKGFMKAGGTSFQYDTKQIQNHIDEISHNVYKEIQQSNKDIKYENIRDMLMSCYANSNNTYSLGQNVSDSRGRSIFACTSKIFNPVSHKDARASLICRNKSLTKEGCKAVYAFISELLGYRGKNYDDKVKYGESAYILHTLPKPQGKELHEYIWLSRIYDALDNYDENMGWNIPIEIDATASMLQMIGVLTNDHELMKLTNMINTSEFQDAWTINGVPRDFVKKAMTPRLYGSSAEPKQLWLKHKFDFNQEHINIVTKELREGRFKHANNFKDFVIGNVQPSPKMVVRIWNEEFQIICNRFVPGKETLKTYWVWNGKEMKRITHHSLEIPDLNSFKRYFQTLLIHNLDSQVANHICEELDWVLPNHDAFVLHPNDVEKCRELYIKKMYNIYRNRHTILSNYFRSINIWDNWEEENNEEIKEFSPYCLK